MHIFQSKLLFFLIGYHVSIEAFENREKEKRLLLNDPDVLGARIAHLEQQQHMLTQISKDMNASLYARITELLSKQAELESHIHKQDQIITASLGQGSTYVRWGRRHCTASHTEHIYSGYTAGQYYQYSTTRHGGPANTLCLPDDPQLSNVTFTYTDSLIRGTEYERNTFAPNSYDEDIPCAVCRSISTTTTIMIPGRQTCYNGWKMEYDGFIASGHVTHSASNYICIDRNPEYLPSGKAGNDGHLMYMVGIKCGPLPCPPYDNNRKLSCVVCSK